MSSEPLVVPAGVECLEAKTIYSDYAFVVPSDREKEIGDCLKSIRKHMPGAGVIVQPRVRERFNWSWSVNQGLGHARSLFRPAFYIVMGDDVELTGPLVGQRDCITLPYVVGPVGEHAQMWTPDAVEREVTFGCFVCACIPSSAVWGDIGGFDDSFADYGYDDDDYCYRARLAGYKIRFTLPPVHHERTLKSHFRSSGEPVSLEKNFNRFVEKWGKSPYEVR